MKQLVRYVLGIAAFLSSGHATNTKTQAIEPIRLVPVAKTILRQVTF